MHCIIATEGPERPDGPDPGTLITASLKKIPEYSQWYFEVCHDAKELLSLPSTPDVVVVSRFLPGEKMGTLLKHLPVLKSSSRIILLSGRLNEASKAFINMAHSKGLTNIVTGKLPGDRPYTLPVALLQDKETGIPGTPEIPDVPDILETSVITRDNNDLAVLPNENAKNVTVSTSVEKIDKTRSLEVVWPTYIEEHRDYLGIPDRYVYDEAMAIALSEAEKQKTGFGIILLKMHLVEDYILKKIMQKIKKNLRYTDFIAHYDGKKIILIIPDYNDVMLVAEKIKGLCDDNTFIPDKQSPKVICSYGCALYPDNGKTANELFNQAISLLGGSKPNEEHVISDKALIEDNSEQIYNGNSDHSDLNNIISSIVDYQPQAQYNNTFIPSTNHNEIHQTSYRPILDLNNRQKGLLCLTTSNKGGVGKTTVMISLAEAIARAEVPTCVVDFDFGAPDLATFFKINKGPGIEYLAGKVPRPGYADDVIRKVRDNLYVLPGPMNATFPQFEPGQLKYLLDVLLAKYAVVIGDTSPEFWTKSWYGEIFEIADLVYAIVDQSIFSEQETVIYAPRLIGMGVAPEKIRLVLNKFSPRLHNAKIIEDHFCSKIKKHVPTKLLPRVAATIPEDWDAHAIGGYKSQTVGLDDAYSQWHKLAGEVAQLAGFSYDVTPGKKHKNREDVIQKLIGRFKKK